jgi:uncharacterized protein YuzE
MTGPIRSTYDPEGDILFVTFASPTPSTGYQISDQILLGVNPDSGQAAGLMILNSRNEIGKSASAVEVGTRYGWMQHQTGKSVTDPGRPHGVLPLSPSRQAMGLGVQTYACSIYKKKHMC